MDFGGQQSLTVQINQNQLPKKVGILGYGAIGKAFVEILLSQYPKTQIVVVDLYDLPYKESRFQFVKSKIQRGQVDAVLDIMKLQKGDFLVDLSTDIDFRDLWPVCQKNNIRYLNTSMELWDDNFFAQSYPKNEQEQYESSIGYIRDKALEESNWNNKNGPTSIFEFGFNPGIISQMVKRGLEDASRHVLQNQDGFKDIDKKSLEKWLQQKNHSKLAQTLGVHTIQCTERDDQRIPQTPKDVQTKLYNTWSCRGLLTEALLPVQVARGSHEDYYFDNTFNVIRNGKTIMSKNPAIKTWAKSWLPNQNIIGAVIPHGESYSIHDYLHDPQTGYYPTQMFVYDYNHYAKEFILNLPKDSTLENTLPKTEVIHPMNYELRGVNKVGALILMKNNRGWWTGSVMDDIDCASLLDHKFGPTVIQVAAGAYSAFLWGCLNPNKGCKFAEYLDTDFLLEKVSPYIGRLVSKPVDLTQTSVKDCNKFQDFLMKVPTVKEEIKVPSQQQQESYQPINVTI